MRGGAKTPSSTPAAPRMNGALRIVSTQARRPHRGRRRAAADRCGPSTPAEPRQNTTRSGLVGEGKSCSTPAEAELGARRRDAGRRRGSRVRNAVVPIGRARRHLTREPNSGQGEPVWTMPGDCLHAHSRMADFIRYASHPATRGGSTSTVAFLPWYSSSSSPPGRATPTDWTRVVDREPLRRASPAKSTADTERHPSGTVHPARPLGRLRSGHERPAAASTFPTPRTERHEPAAAAVPELRRRHPLPPTRSTRPRRRTASRHRSRPRHTGGSKRSHCGQAAPRSAYPRPGAASYAATQQPACGASPAPARAAGFHRTPSRASRSSSPSRSPRSGALQVLIQPFLLSSIVLLGLRRWWLRHLHPCCSGVVTFLASAAALVLGLIAVRRPGGGVFAGSRSASAACNCWGIVSAGSPACSTRSCKRARVELHLGPETPRLT